MIIGMNLVIQRLLPTKPADLYVGCAGEWRYPSYLLPALRAAGFSTIEVPLRDARAMVMIDGIWNVLWRVRLLRPDQAINSLVAIDRHPERLQGAPCSNVMVSVDCFSGEIQDDAIVMPYFMHPELRRFEKEVPSMRAEHRSICIGFAGTIQDRAYRDGFEFPIMTRSDVFDALNARFADQIASVTTRDTRDLISRPTRPIVIVAVDDTSDSTAKYVLRGRDYMRFLGSCAFAVCPPGCRIPQAHNIVEAMLLGAIPITNYGEYLAPPLDDGVNCLSFDTADELQQAVEHAIRMPVDERERLQAGVNDYVATYLSTEAFGRRLRSELGQSSVIVVNAEGESAALWSERRAAMLHDQPPSPPGPGGRRRPPGRPTTGDGDGDGALG